MSIDLNSRKSSTLVAWTVLLASHLLPLRGEVPDLAASGVRTKIGTVLSALPNFLDNDPSGVGAQVYLNRQRLLVDVIQPYFYGVPGALHESSPARLDRVRQVEDFLSPHVPILLRTFSAVAGEAQAPNAAGQILAFAKPSDHVRDTLLSIARADSSDVQRAGEAYETLFMLRLDDANVRKEVLEKIAWRDDRHTRAELARDLLLRAATRWGLAELEPSYRKSLSIPFVSENYPAYGGRERLRGDYEIAIRGLKAFGESASSFGVLLRARLQEMDAIRDRDIIALCRECIEIVEGRAMPVPICNWKGELLGISSRTFPQWKAPHAANPSMSARSIVTDPEKGSSTVAQPEAQARIAQNTSIPRLWWIIALPVGASLLWLLFKGRRRVHQR